MKVIFVIIAALFAAAAGPRSRTGLAEQAYYVGCAVSSRRRHRCVSLAHCQYSCRSNWAGR